MANTYYSYGGANQGYANTGYTPVQQPQATVASYNVPQTAYVQSPANPPQAYASYGNMQNNAPASTPGYAYSNTQQTTAVPVADTSQTYQQNTYGGYSTAQQPQVYKQTTNFSKPAAPQHSQTHYYQASQPQSQNPIPTNTNYYSNNQATVHHNPPAVHQRTLTIPQTQPIPVQQITPIAPKKDYQKKKIDRPTMPTFSKPQPKDQISNYERALLSAATNYVNTNKRTGGGGSGGKSSTASYWKQRREQMKDPNKPIVASEVKGYLYAWLGKFRSRPDYTITPKGSSPFNQTFVCELKAPGFSYVGQGKASNKKDSQTRAAWDFCDWLVKEGKMQTSELPYRENKFQIKTSTTGSTGTTTTTTTPAVAKPAVNNVNKTVVKPKMNFVGGSQLKLTNKGYAEIKKETPAATAAPAVKTEPKPATAKTLAPNPAVTPKPVGKMDKNTPVGEEYVEQVWTDGRVIRYRCSLCECEFTDSAARELHVRGRRHKLSYKKKVDPSIEVDVKLNPKQRKLMEIKLHNEKKKENYRARREQNQKWELQMQKWEEENMRLYEEELLERYEEEKMMYEMEMRHYRMRGMRPPMHCQPPIPPMLYSTKMNRRPVKKPPTLDDQHVIKKHGLIYPTDDELGAVQNTVNMLEKALKAVSDKIHEQELKVFTASNAKHAPVRLLKAVMRCGAVAKGLLLKDEREIGLVLLCNEKPTSNMLQRVVDNLPDQLANICDQTFSMKVDILDCSIILLTSSDPKIKVKVTLTSTAMRELSEDKKEDAASKQRPDPPNVLNRDRCCVALAELRHTKWFQAKASNIPTCVMLIRVMKDLCKRSPHWRPLKPWALELIAANALSSSEQPLSPCEGLRRIFEVVASGILLENGGGILDPCERDPTDAAGNLNTQEREDITASAQHALRLILYRQVYKILNIEKIIPPDPASRKRTQNAEKQEDEKAEAGPAKTLKLEKNEE